MTARAVAEILQVIDRTLRRWVAADILHPIRFGGTLRFHASEVDHLITHGFAKHEEIRGFASLSQVLFQTYPKSEWR